MINESFLPVLFMPGRNDESAMELVKWKKTMSQNETSLVTPNETSL